MVRLHGAPDDRQVGNSDTTTKPKPTDRAEANGEAKPDPFDPESLRLSQDFARDLGVKKVLTRVPVRKPDKSWWVRVHPEPTYHETVGILELKEAGEAYLVTRNLWDHLATETCFGPRKLFLTINRQGVVFFWMVTLPGADGRSNSWSDSALEAASRAQRNWIRVTANMGLGGYDVYQTEADIPEPNWPELSMRDLLAIAFKDRLITAADHPVLQELRGEK